MRSKGQALVEFTLIFVLLLIVAWIPADFGLAFYTGQITQNAARETARIVAAERTLPTMPIDCNMPCSGAAEILQVAAKRMPAALLTGTNIRLNTTNTGTCNVLVEARISGQYNFFFYRLLNFFGLGGRTSAPITRTALMRWEHQAGCAGGGTP